MYLRVVDHGTSPIAAKANMHLPGVRGALSTLAIPMQQKAKTTAPRIPTWSPTVVLTRRYSG